MERLACVDVPALPLQLALREHPDWRRHPVAVVEDDRAQSPILWVNGRARQAGVAPGMSYASALALAPALRAVPLAPEPIARAVEAIAARLRAFSPEVEPAAEIPGVFWACLAGLHRLYASPAVWATAVRADLAAAGIVAVVVVGFTRFGTYAVAHLTRSVRILADPREERAAAGRVPLSRLGELPPHALEALHQLGVDSVDAFVRLPAAGVLERFGPEVHRLHRRAAGDLWDPLHPQVPAEPVRRTVLLDTPERDAEGLLFLLKRLLHPMLAALAARGQALAALAVRLRPEGHPWQIERLRPAAPTLDVVQILDLVRLRLESLAMPGGIVEVDLEAEGQPAPPDQLHLFAEHRQRDLAAGARALARLRARFGDDAVVRPVVRQGHLPEARAGWEPVEQLQPPQPRPPRERALVRRVCARPQALPAPPRAHHDDGWLLSGVERGSVVDQAGPYVVSGGWWVREVWRDYYYVQTQRGEVLWVYYDRRRRKWFLHGRVE